MSKRVHLPGQPLGEAAIGAPTEAAGRFINFYRGGILRGYVERANDTNLCDAYLVPTGSDGSEDYLLKPDQVPAVDAVQMLLASTVGREPLVTPRPRP